MSEKFHLRYSEKSVRTGTSRSFGLLLSGTVVPLGGNHIFNIEQGFLAIYLLYESSGPAGLPRDGHQGGGRVAAPKRSGRAIG